MMRGGKIGNARLDTLGAYPFERLHALLADCKPPHGLGLIDAGAGEPRLPLPAFVQPVLEKSLHGFSRYPATRGGDLLRQAVAEWLVRRYGLEKIEAECQVLSANGTREALFAVAHALVNPDAGEPKPVVMMPNPMYQIYLGAAVLAGAEPCFLNCRPETGFAPELDQVDEAIWQRTTFIYVCSPSNPTGWVADADWMARLIALADRYDFTIVSDECYSEIYWQDPPVGLLEVCARMGRHDYRRCLVMNSLSKRSALPGLRSGFIAGDAEIIARFARLRSYTGPATPEPLQAVAAAAWRDEEHVREHRLIHCRSLESFYEVYGSGAPAAATFFVWLPVGDGETFARAAWQQQGVKLLPGSFLSATTAEGYNPGSGFVRAALVDGPETAAELARRLKAVKV